MGVSPSWSQMVFKAFLMPQKIFSMFYFLISLLNSSGKLLTLTDFDRFMFLKYCFVTLKAVIHYFCQLQ